MNDISPSESRLSHLFYRFYRLPLWLRIASAALLIGLPFLIVYLYGQLSAFLAGGLWRMTLIEPTIILYIFLVAPIFSRNEAQLIQGLRPVVEIRDAEYAEIVRRTTQGDDRLEFGAFLIGMGFGLLVEQPAARPPGSPMALSIYLLATSVFMYGLLAWIIVTSIASSRLVSTLLKQPLDIDIFHIKPFEPIGRQSLMLSLSFIVGITITLLFFTSLEAIANPLNLAFYAVLLTVSVLLFFLNMRPTHRVLAAVRKANLSEAETQISRLYQQLRERAGSAQDAAQIALELNVWLAMEERLKTTRSWPYNTEMLRTLTVSVLTPIAIGVSRFAAAMLQAGG